MQEYKKRYPVVVNPIYKHSLERRINLGGEWNFRLDPEDIGTKEEWFKHLYLTPDRIQVPGCWQGQGYGNSDNDFVRDFRYDVRVFKATYRGTGWYSKIFRIPKEWRGLKVRLNFGGVNPTAEIWVNGKKIGSNHLPFVPFGFDITEDISFDENNIVVVKVSEQDRIMSMCYNWSGNWSGLYRTVELTAYDKIGIDEVMLYPDSETGEIEVKIKTIGEVTSKDRVKYGIKVIDIDNQSKVLKANVFDLSNTNYNKEYFTFKIKIDRHKNWSPKSPNLYRVDSEISIDDKICDAISSRIGFVKFSIENKHIKINKDPYYLRGTGDFYEIPETGSPDTSRERWRRKLGNLRAYGYNYVRCQSYVPIPEYIDVADEVGLIVQSEMGILGGLGGHSMWHTYQWPQPMPDIYKLLITQWNSIVRRDVNHPSANMYNMSNELRGNRNRTEYPKIAWKAYNDTKKIKPFSLVIWTDGGLNEDLPGDFVNTMAADDEKTHKPVIQHEFEWWCSYPDIRLAPKFKATRPYAIEIAYKAALRHNISHTLIDAAIASQRLQFIEIKTNMEQVRKDYPTLAGMCHFNAMDTIGSPQGIINLFYEKKYADSNTWLQTNGDTVILTNLFFGDRVYNSGDKFKCKLYVSDFSTPHFKNPIIKWRVKIGDKLIQQGDIQYEHSPYLTCYAGEVNIIVPNVNVASYAHLEAELLENGENVTNKWSLWFLPEKRAIDVNEMYFCSNGIVEWIETLKEMLPRYCPNSLEQPSILVTDNLTRELIDYTKGGGRIFFTAGEKLVRAFHYKWSFIHGARYYYSNKACYPPYEDGQNCTIIKDHPIFGDFPHEQFADLQFFNMLAESPAIDLEALDLNDEDPLMRMVHNYQVGRSLGQLIERRIGKGLIVICSLNLDQRLPEAKYLFSNICEYIRKVDTRKIRPISEKALEALLLANFKVNKP
jgi:hypothetical protein